MTTKHALEMAIKALLTGHHHRELCEQAVEQCKSALAELESVEPYIYQVVDADDTYYTKEKPVYKGFYFVEPLFTSPQTREWVGLTNEQIYETVGDGVMDIALAIEAKLRDLNTKG